MSFFIVCIALRAFKALCHLLLARHLLIQNVSSSCKCHHHFYYPHHYDYHHLQHVHIDLLILKPGMLKTLTSWHPDNFYGNIYSLMVSKHNLSLRSKTNSFETRSLAGWLMWAISSVARSYSQFSTRAIVRYLNLMKLPPLHHEISLSFIFRHMISHIIVHWKTFKIIISVCLTWILSRRGTCPQQEACRWPPPHSTCQRRGQPPGSSSPPAPCILSTSDYWV